MTKLKEVLDRIPLVSWFVSVSSRARLPGFEGMTAYDLWETYSMGIVQGAFTLRASAISYSFFMAIFPFILFMLNLIPFVPVDNFQVQFLEFVNGLLPAQAAGSFDNIFREIALQENTGLLTVAFITSLFFMSNGVNAIFDGFERSYHSSFNRNMLRQYFISVGVSLLLTLFLLISIVLFGVVEYWIALLRAQDFMTQSSTEIGLIIVRYVTIIFLLYVFVSTLYYTGTKEGRQTRFFSIGSVITTLLILLSSYLYGLYIDNFASYNEIYGSIGALLILMIYIWLSANILLLGFELNASIRSLKARNLK
ncbi:YihY/virulence factor BrkB family protein [Nonlabens marinus]|uniref:Inner membrane protein YihY, formerly thought to be RNase BN n=1 Tax=Nonlabens marinus S1-08 TaxID=1454201 RepID=W8VXT5_9FLAO|nr:YihY/virulence factor BrkB family protein [Nonlabens marinus]BAO56487.1 inner membrane protein YihY, formerly thought to be RNase BN [Nonlabens marinus S1-08]